MNESNRLKFIVGVVVVVIFGGIAFVYTTKEYLKIKPTYSNADQGQVYKDYSQYNSLPEVKGASVSREEIMNENNKNNLSEIYVNPFK